MRGGGQQQGESNNSILSLENGIVAVSQREQTVLYVATFTQYRLKTLTGHLVHSELFNIFALFTVKWRSRLNLTLVSGFNSFQCT